MTERSHSLSNHRPVNMAEQESAFLRFLLQASTRQAKCLLEQSTGIQLQALGEVCYNLLHGDLEPELLKDLKPYGALIRRLANRHLSAAQRREIASKRAKTVIQILRLAEGVLP